MKRVVVNIQNHPEKGDYVFLIPENPREGDRVVWFSNRDFSYNLIRLREEEIKEKAILRGLFSSGDTYTRLKWLTFHPGQIPTSGLLVQELLAGSKSNPDSVVEKFSIDPELKKVFQPISLGIGHYVLLVFEKVSDQEISISMVDSVNVARSSGAREIREYLLTRLVNALNSNVTECLWFHFSTKQKIYQPITQPGDNSCGVFTVFNALMLAGHTLPDWVLDWPYDITGSRQLSDEERDRMVGYMLLMTQTGRPVSPEGSLDILSHDANDPAVHVITGLDPLSRSTEEIVTQAVHGLTYLPSSYAGEPNKDVQILIRPEESYGKPQVFVAPAAVAPAGGAPAPAPAPVAPAAPQPSSLAPISTLKAELHTVVEYKQNMPGFFKDIGICAGIGGAAGAVVGGAIGILLLVTPPGALALSILGLTAFVASLTTTEFVALSALAGVVGASVCSGGGATIARCVVGEKARQVGPNKM